jgi:hypothetical protein
MGAERQTTGTEWLYAEYGLKGGQSQKAKSIILLNRRFFSKIFSESLMPDVDVSKNFDNKENANCDYLRNLRNLQLEESWFSTFLRLPLQLQVFY